MNSFGAAGDLRVGGRESLRIFRLEALGPEVARMPYSIKILLENLLRHEDGSVVKAEQVERLARWDGTPPAGLDIAFFPSRVLLQDLTGVPAVVDLAAMRDAVAALGGDPAGVNPQIPVDLVIDHSVIAGVARRPDALAVNARAEMDQNRERFEFLRWAQAAFDHLTVAPPDTGICHQVNLERLSTVVRATGAGEAFPDTLVGADSHTPMVNGLGVLGWGVGGIEAEAAMLAQPLTMVVPPVVGLRLVGELREGVTATDLVLRIAELLRHHGVVGKFVEAYGPGLASVPVENRATIGNMSPEYGSTVTIFPIDEETLRYLRLTGRTPEQVSLVEAYAKEQGLFHEAGGDEPLFTEELELDLSSVEPSLAGPSRPQDRVSLDDVARVTRAVAGVGREAPPGGAGPSSASSSVTTAVLEDGSKVELDHGSVVIAAITSCTNTSNPMVMVAAGVLARRAVEAGLATKPWVKTSLAPGSLVVTEYLRAAGLLEPLASLGFDLVGYGCTTCIGNSGPLLPGVSEAVNDADLSVSAVLSGNRNFEGRIHPDVRLNWLASPPLVVAYALAGTTALDLTRQPLGQGGDGRDVFLSDLWPASAEVAEIIRSTMSSAMFSEVYDPLLSGAAWGGEEVEGSTAYAWDPESTYVRRPPFLDGVTKELPPVEDILGARALAVFGDSFTTDHISPAGAIRKDSPAGRWLIDHGVHPPEFNSYGTRRGNHEVMIRGTFANVRVRNKMVPGTEGGYTVHVPSGEVCTIFEASERYRAEGVPLVVLAGLEYGTGSSRDWAAKGPLLLGVRAVIAGSFERIHRSNLVGMGIIPLELVAPDSVESLGLTGRETFDVVGLSALAGGEVPKRLTVRADGKSFEVRPRLDTPQDLTTYLHGGILPYVTRQLTG